MVDLSYLASIASDELISLQELIQQKTKVPTEAWDQFGTSGYLLLKLDSRDDPSVEDLRNMKVAYDDFLKLCESSPNTDPDTLLYFSAAHTSLLLALHDGGAHTPDERVKHIVFAAESKIYALTIPTIAAIFGHLASKTKKLSEAGQSGAKQKNRKYEAIKLWALNEVGSKAGSQKKIARKLSKAMPAHLAGISEDPERLIYDALRSKTLR